MAYVAISHNLTSEVKDNIREMEQNENKVLGNFDNTVRGDLAVFDKPFWKDKLELKAQMPADWCAQVTEAELVIDFAIAEGEPVQSHCIDVKFDPYLIVPPKQQTYRVKIKVSAEVPEFAPLIERYKRVQEVEARWEKVRDQVGGFLNKCKSLNEALKLWPQIEMYIPKQFMDRANKKSERTKAGESSAAEALKSMDTDHLTSAAVIARISRTGN